MASCSTGDRCGSAGGFPNICTWVDVFCSRLYHEVSIQVRPILIYEGRRNLSTCHNCKPCLGSLAVAHCPGTNGLSPLHRRQLMAKSLYLEAACSSGLG